MRKAQKRNWEKKTSPCYVEEHHVFPTSIFGRNNITVFLTAREHYVAHALLYKALKKRYGSNHSRAIKMQFAYWAMSNGQIKKRYVNSRLYEKLREEFSKGISGENSPMWGKTGENNPFWGKTHSPETKKKISEKLSGENNPNWGRTGENHPMWGRTGENNPNWGKTHSPETKKKISEAAKLRTGENHPMWGKTLSPETKKKISEAAKLRTGENHPMWGTIWITNGTKEGSYKIKKSEVIPSGYRKGRVCK